MKDFVRSVPMGYIIDGLPNDSPENRVKGGKLSRHESAFSPSLAALTFLKAEFESTESRVSIAALNQKR